MISFNLMTLTRPSGGIYFNDQIPMMTTPTTARIFTQLYFAASVQHN
jgi:hypothetical protein